MEYFLQQLINGVTLGSIYGLIAIGYTMVFGIIGMVNFAHGDVFMVSTFIALIFLLVLTQALGLGSPAWFHAPLVLDASGRRLAKRADDLSLEALREAGVDARAILGWVAASAGLGACEPRITARELVSAYQPTHLRREPTLLSAQDIDALREQRVR